MTLEGTQVWELALRLAGQTRIAGRSILGWDMAAALSLASALGIPAKAVAEFLPDIEAQMVRRLNEQIRSESETHG